MSGILGSDVGFGLLSLMTDGDLFCGLLSGLLGRPRMARCGSKYLGRLGGRLFPLSEFSSSCLLVGLFAVVQSPYIS